MKRISRLQQITDYVAEHPFCYSTEIEKGTGLIKSTVMSSLTRLVIDGKLMRDGFFGKYRYSTPTDYRPTAEVATVETQPKPMSGHALLNTLLRSVRESRA